MSQPVEEPKRNKLHRPKPREVMKFVAKEVVAYKVASMTRSVLAAHTELETDNIVVMIGCKVVGYYVAGMAEPLTDKAVDKSADFTLERLADRKTKRQAKKEAKKIAKTQKD